MRDLQRFLDAQADSYATALADDVNAFWFADPNRAWKHDPAFDQEIRAKFYSLYVDTMHGKHEDWLATAAGSLAYVLTLDQFPRNMFREDPRMFEGDAKALAATEHAIAVGQDMQLPAVEVGFLYMPFMHAESLEIQTRAVSLFRAHAPQQLRYLEQHLEVLRKFGRFPHRNRFLGRTSSHAEEAFLESGGPTFGT